MELDIQSASMDFFLFCRLFRLNSNHSLNLPIRLSEIGVLIFIATASCPVSPADISNFLEISKPCATESIKVLIHDGYIVRTPSHIDGRSCLLSPTERGIKLVEETSVEYTRLVSKILAGMGREKFCKLLYLIKEANEILKE